MKLRRERYVAGKIPRTLKDFKELAEGFADSRYTERDANGWSVVDAAIGALIVIHESEGSSVTMSPEIREFLRNDAGKGRAFLQAWERFERMRREV